MRKLLLLIAAFISVTAFSQQAALISGKKIQATQEMQIGAKTVSTFAEIVNPTTQTVAQFNDTAVRKDMSDIAKLPNGNLVMVYTKYRLGAGDGNVADINWAISTNSGKTWTDKGRAYSNFSVSIYQPSIIAQPDGDIIILFNVKTGANTAQIYKGRLASGATTWSAATSIYNPGAYLVQSSNRIFNDYNYSGKLFYAVELSSNGAQACDNVLSTGIILTSSNYGDTWALSGTTITSGTNKVEEPGFYRIADSLYCYWRSNTGVVLGRKSTDNGATFGAEFSYNLGAPCSMSTLKYFSDYDLLIAIHNKYNGTLYASGSRAIFQIDASNDRGQTFTPVYVFPKYDGYYLHQPAIFYDAGYIITQYSKIKTAEDSASQVQTVFNLSDLLPKTVQYQTANKFTWQGSNGYSYITDISQFPGSVTHIINPVSGDNTYTTIQKSTLSAKFLPHVDAYGRLITKSISPQVDTTTGTMTLPLGLNLNGIATSNGTITAQANSSASVFAARLRATSNDFAQFNFYTSDGATQIAAFGSDRVGTNGGGFYVVTKADGGAATQNFTLRSTGMYIGGSTAPTALVHLAAGTTSRAQIRLSDGVAPTSPNDGDMWREGTDLKIRLSGVTYTIQKL